MEFFHTPVKVPYSTYHISEGHMYAQLLPYGGAAQGTTRNCLCFRTTAATCWLSSETLLRVLRVFVFFWFFSWKFNGQCSVLRCVVKMEMFRVAQLAIA